jgi:hypothetical protein
MKSRWQQEMDALPEWVQQMVRALSGSAGYGFSAPKIVSNPENFEEFNVILRRGEHYHGWFDGFLHMNELAGALSAPWPPPTNLPPHEQMTTTNVVEMVTAGDDDCAFDQPCYFGHRVESHAVYCHNDAWPDSPRKCRRSAAGYPHQDCPGFVPNSVKTREPNE